MPRDFFEQVVRRAVDEWQQSPLDELRAKQAANELNNMADRLFHYWGKGAAQVHGAIKVADYRRALVARECVDFQLLWDVADAHKHLKLTRPDRRITGDEQTRIGAMGFGEGGFGEGPYGGGDQFVIEVDDGTRRALEGVVRNVLAMWERLIPR